MMIVQTFCVALVFSFLGSIPPGTLNLTVLQLGLEGKQTTAWQFALGAALIEYPYAWIALLFADWITTTPAVIDNFKLLTAIVMITLGIFTIRAVQKPAQRIETVRENGFKRGLVLGILNPLALPFWIGITAYLKAQGWITLSTQVEVHSYLLGICVGAFALLMLLAYLTNRVSSVLSPTAKVKFIPGVVLLLLGLYALIQFLLSR